MGLRFPNRIGLAAGLDKNAQVPDVFAAMGFGFVEIGTITPKGQPGNPKPRLFRVPQDSALINRMGFNNDGLEVIRTRLKHVKTRNFILGGNIGKNTVTENDVAIFDYQTVLEGIYHEVDYIVLNVSCPNIANLSQLQNQDYLGAIMKMMTKYRERNDIYKPLVIKISPDLQTNNLHETLELIKQFDFNGIIISNTTTSRDKLTISDAKIKSIGNGGLSGKPLFEKNVSIIKEIRKNMPSTVAIIGCGGIFSQTDAKIMYDAGADLLQIYTGFIYQGPGFVKKLNRLQMYQS
jgi:dihydroorotate dehydrogenase